MKLVTDPNILSQLNSVNPVTDQQTLDQLNGRPPLRAPDANIFQRTGQNYNEFISTAQVLRDKTKTDNRSELQNLLPMIGNSAGFVGKELLEPVISGYKTLKDIAPETTGKIENTLGSALGSFANSDIGQKAIGAAQSALGAYDQYVAKPHPIISDNIKGALQTLSLVNPASLRAIEGGGAAAKGATSLAGKAVQTPVNMIAAPAFKAALSAVDDETKQLAQKANQMGIRLRLDQVADSDPLSTAQKVSQEIPFSGVRQFEKLQNKDVNQAVGKAVGVDTKAWNSKTLDNAFNDIGGEFNKFFSGKKFTFDQNRMNSIGKIAEEAERLSGSDTHKIVRNVVNDFVKDIGPNGEVTGEKLNELRKNLGEFMRSNKDQAGEAAEKYVQKILDEVLDVVTSGDPKTKSDFTNLKYRYKNLITIQPLVGKATRGDLNSQLLENAVKRVWGEDAYARGKAGELGDIAKISKTFLTKQRGSDTLPKAGYLGAASAALNPALATIAAPKVVGATALNRLYQNSLTSPRVVKSFLKKK